MNLKRMKKEKISSNMTVTMLMGMISLKLRRLWFIASWMLIGMKAAI
jgi:hypothetical protein